ncbi:vomeronasal type-2 receptor 26-like [Lissotriton helveticus]
MAWCLPSLFLLLLPIPAALTSMRRCHLDQLGVGGAFQDGDVILGGMFPIHYKTLLREISFTEPPRRPTCETFSFRAYRWVLSMLFTIDELNSNLAILPNLTLGFGIIDSCNAVLGALEGITRLTTGKENVIPNYSYQESPRLLAILGDAGMMQTVAMAQHLGIYRIPQLLHYVRLVRFQANIQEEIFFDANGYTPPIYDVINWQVNTHGLVNFIKVGSFDTSAPQGQDLVINDSAILWKGGSHQPTRSVCSESCPPGYRKVERQGEPACCFECLPCSAGNIANQSDSTDCLKCPDDQWSNDSRDKCVPKEIEFLVFSEPVGALLTSVAVTGSLLPVTILLIFIKHQDTPIVKANHQALSYVLLLALASCYLCSLIFIGQPSIWTCMLRQAAFGILFTFSLSCILAKTTVVVFAFKATKPNSQLKRCVGPKLPNSVVFFSTLLQVMLCTSWLASWPPFPEKNMTSQLGKIIIECNEGSSKAFWCMLGYMCLLVGISFVMAFLARKLPDSFNEAKHITFSMLVCGSVWVSFIPAYLSTRGKHMVAVEIFAILASSTGLVMCMFLPKCYIILLKPDMNTREYLLGSKTFKKR